MKVLFSNGLPFYLAHGGTQTLLESLMRELAAVGVQVEPERWWDEHQNGDILHYMNRPPVNNVRLAQQKGFKVVMTENLDATASRTPFQLLNQRCLTKFAQRFLPGGLTNRLGWEVYHELDAMVYVVQHEWETAQYLFGADPARGHVIPHGLEAEAMRQLALPEKEGNHLISVATIHSRKNAVLLARAASESSTPIVFLGKPYANDDPYYREFKQLVDGRIVQYPGFVSNEEKYRLLRSARGFVLLSQFESGSIAIYEAAGAGLPLLLSDLPWASRVYPAAEFVRLGNPAAIVAALKTFYQQARRQSSPTFPLLTWRQVAERYVELYRKVLCAA